MTKAETIKKKWPSDVTRNGVAFEWWLAKNQSDALTAVEERISLGARDERAAHLVTSTVKLTPKP